jgi:hypothetical protein
MENLEQENITTENKYMGANIYLKEMPIKEKETEIQIEEKKYIGYYTQSWKKIFDFLIGITIAITLTYTKVFHLTNNFKHLLLLLFLLIIIFFRINRKYIAIGILIYMPILLYVLITSI